MTVDGIGVCSMTRKLWVWTAAMGLGAAAVVGCSSTSNTNTSATTVAAGTTPTTTPATQAPATEPPATAAEGTVPEGTTPGTSPSGAQSFVDAMKAAKIEQSKVDCVNGKADSDPTVKRIILSTDSGNLSKDDATVIVKVIDDCMTKADLAKIVSVGAPSDAATCIQGVFEKASDDDLIAFLTEGQTGTGPVVQGLTACLGGGTPTTTG
jgi:hypothetical protein